MAYGTDQLGDTGKGLLGTLAGDVLGGLTGGVGSMLGGMVSSGLSDLLGAGQNAAKDMLKMQIAEQPNMFINQAGQVGRQASYGAKTALGQNQVEADAASTYNRLNKMGSQLIGNQYQNALNSNRLQQGQTSRLAGMLRGMVGGSTPVSALGDVLSNLGGTIGQQNQQLAAQNSQGLQGAYAQAGQLAANAGQGLQQAKLGFMERRVKPYLTEMNPAAGAMFGTAGQYGSTAVNEGSSMIKPLLPSTSAALASAGAHYLGNVPYSDIAEGLNNKTPQAKAVEGSYNYMNGMQPERKFNYITGKYEG